ncbi:SsgA family sporulation/cell division regulator [Streptomyces sp. NPDC052236]|uniref:SsgA family sporulation/cell division regulator n=1 Tax=Streptomyces sp. NPDC052236 TaxID=3365686 RepID=UPI0037CD8A98
MSPAVEDHALARIVTDAPQHRSVRVALRYDPADDPQTVRFAFPRGSASDREWAFPRELLETGLRYPARHGDVGIWPCGRVQTVLEFHTPDGVAVVQFDAKALIRFLRHTYAVAAPATRR